MAQAFIISGQHVRIRHHLAGLAPRAVALLIDLMLIYFYFSGIAILDSHIHWERLLNTWAFFFLLVLPALCYIPLCEVFCNGQTLGKRLLHIRTVRLDGAPLGVSDAALRFLLLPIDGFFGMGLGAVLIALTPRSQRLGDLAAGTTVVSDRAFKNSRVDLRPYEYLMQAYRPVFVRATELTDKQAHVIEHALASKGKDRPERISKLCAKVEPICGTRSSKGLTEEDYLATVLNDYRFYQLDKA